MTKHATTASPRRRKSMTATAPGQDRFNEHTPARAMNPTVTRDPQAVRKLAALRGMAGTKTAPMDNAERAEHYRRQRGGASAVAPVLTARQRRRLRKNRHHLTGQGMTGAEYDRMRAAQRAARIRRGYAG